VQATPSHAHTHGRGATKPAHAASHSPWRGCPMAPRSESPAPSDDVHQQRRCGICVGTRGNEHADVAPAQPADSARITARREAARNASGLASRLARRRRARRAGDGNLQPVQRVASAAAGYAAAPLTRDRTRRLHAAAARPDPHTHSTAHSLSHTQSRHARCPHAHARHHVPDTRGGAWGGS